MLTPNFIFSSVSLAESLFDQRFMIKVRTHGAQSPGARTEKIMGRANEPAARKSPARVLRTYSGSLNTVSM